MERLDGKKIIVTGGTSGMGEGVVRAFPALGAKVVFWGRNAAAGEKIAQETGAIFLKADVADKASVDEAMKKSVAAIKTAKEKNIPVQPKTTVAGGNDAGAIHKACSGVYTIAVSLPCRYIHSGTSVGDKNDMQACYDLAVALCEEYANA